MKEIVLPEEPTPPSLEDQIRGAIYGASHYYLPTKIRHGHRVVYLIDASIYERLVAPALGDQEAQK